MANLKPSRRFTPSRWAERLIPILLVVLGLLLLVTLAIILLAVLGLIPKI